MAEEKENIKMELNELAPNLSKIEKKNSFEVPEDYFYGLSDKIQKRVEGSQSKTIPIIQLFQFSYTRIAVASIIIAIVCTSIYYLTSRSQNDSEAQMITENYVLNEVDEEVLIDYIVENDLITGNLNNEFEEIVLDEFDENLILNEL